MMAYPQPYPQVQQVSQVIRRQMTAEEMQLPGRFYKGLQNGLRGLSLFCLILFVFSTFVLPVMMFDPVTYDSLSIVLMVFMVVFGLVAIGMSANTIAVRKRTAQAMMEGTAVEVIGPAYRAGAMRKGQGWTVGPISVMPTRGLEGLLVEGAPTSVLCVPRLKAAIAINNIGLKNGARIICPPNLESMAVPVGLPPIPAYGQTQGPPSSGYAAPAPQAQAAQTGYPDEVPPPPPD